MFYLLFHKNKNVIVFLLLISICFSNFIFNFKREDSQFSFLRSSFYFFLTPFFVGFQNLEDFLKDYFYKLLFIDEYYQDVSNLKKNLLEKKVYTLDKLILIENIKRLKGKIFYTNFIEEHFPSIDFIQSRVIFRSNQNPYKHLILDKGLKNGIGTSMPVVAFQFFTDPKTKKQDLKILLVGEIDAADYLTSRVRLLFNQKSMIHAQIKGTPISGFLIGNGGGSNLTLSYIDPNTQIDLENSQSPLELISSSISLHIPYGLKLGFILYESEDRSMNMKRYMVKPYLNLSKLQDVFIFKMDLKDDLKKIIKSMNR